MDFNISFNQTSAAPITASPDVILINVKPLALLALGIVIYAIFIFKFYKYLAKRDILMAGWNKKYDWNENTHHKISKIITYALEYIILVPIIVFFWFLVMALILLFMSNNTAAQIMLLSMAIIAAVRVVSYYSEDLARDLAKLMPLTLLAVFVSNLSFFSLDSTLNNALNMLTIYDKLIFYLLFVVVVEFIMRIIQLIRNSTRKNKGISETRKKIEEQKNKSKSEKKEKPSKNQEDKNLIEIG
ncbi:MAG: hypothetical protein ACP5N3_00875 [Candidatus Nanoarchaeia archaeon]